MRLTLLTSYDLNNVRMKTLCVIPEVCLCHQERPHVITIPIYLNVTLPEKLDEIHYYTEVKGGGGAA